jgi:hypothetical protein
MSRFAVDLRDELRVEKSLDGLRKCVLLSPIDAEHGIYRHGDETDQCAVRLEGRPDTLRLKRTPDMHRNAAREQYMWASLPPWLAIRSQELAEPNDFRPEHDKPLEVFMPTALGDDGR